MRKKIFIALGTLTILVILQSVVSFVLLNIIRDASDKEVFQADTVTTVNEIEVAHYKWLQGLTLTVYTGSEFTGGLDPTACALGTWLSSEDSTSYDDSSFQTLHNHIQTPHSTLHETASQILNLIEAGNHDEAVRLYAEVITPSMEQTLADLASMQEIASANSADALKTMNTSNTTGMIASIIMGVISILVAAFMTLKLTHDIVPPLQKLTQAADQLRQGDIDVTCCDDIKDKSELGKLANAFREMVYGIQSQSAAVNQMAEGDLTASIEVRSEKDTMNRAIEKLLSIMNGSLGEISLSSERVAMGAKQLSNGAQNLAQGATEQASAVDELSSSLSQISKKTTENAQMANDAARLTSTIRDNAQRGADQMDAMMRAVDEINQASQSIKNVISTIDNIAFQTNILALNAAVEAARAGSAGKGFAVVAEEVRSLAAKSAEAAKETGVLIENSVAKAELGARIADETSASLTEIVSGINDSTEIVSRIAGYSDEQAASLTEITMGIDQVAQVVQQNSATAQESAAASEDMSMQSRILNDLISQFKLKSENEELTSQSQLALHS
jgi:methyl-accepting chemotaxis protein